MAQISDSPNIRISPKSKAVLRELAETQGTSMQAVLDAAIAHYQQDIFLDEVNAAFARLKSDPAAWQAELAERAVLEGSLLDGIEPE